MQRALLQTIPARPAADGDGVRLQRVAPPVFAALDPFLMLDEIVVEAADEIVAGFPPHPHRGFETLTYMLAGEIAHADHLGNRGLVGAGGIQWMHAGRGIIHEEMPRPGQHSFHGFQLWLNLPARDKMTPADYRDIPADAVSLRHWPGIELRLIAGSLELAEGRISGPLREAARNLVYVDLRLAPGEKLQLPLSPAQRVLLYPWRGQLVIAGMSLRQRQLGILGEGDTLALEAGCEGAGLLILAGDPIGEPVVQQGPFVMNSRAEIEQALMDYRDGRLTG